MKSKSLCQTGGSLLAYENMTPDQRSHLAPPIDQQDLCYMHHDVCYANARVSRDHQALQDSKFFNETRYEVRGENTKEIYLHIQGKPLNVEQVRIIGYGVLFGQTFAAEAAGPALRPGEPYRRSLANAFAKYLTNRYAGTDRIANVTEDDQLSSDKDLIVTFNVLAYDLDLVRINGKEFHIAPVTIAVP
jgi:hypothetical protein